MKKIISAALTAMVLVSYARAEQPLPFEDEGVLHQLEGYHHFIVSQRPRRVEVDETIYRDNGSSIRFMLIPGDCGPTYDDTWDDCANQNERVDLSLTPWTRHDEEYYTMSLCLDANFRDQHHRDDKSRWADINLFQFKSANGINSCFNLFYNYGFESLAIDNRCADGENYNHGERLVRNLSLSRFDYWYDFIFHVRWSNDDDGFIDLYEGGERIASFIGPTTIPSDDIVSTRPHMFIYRYGIEFYENTSPLTFWADNVGVYYSLTEVPNRFR